MIYDDHIRQAARRAADWLTANRDRHITSVLAITEDGARVDPTDDTAHCFCAAGRLARELGVDGYPQLHAEISEARVDRVIDVNDNDKTTGMVTFGISRFRWLAGMAGVDQLRRIANDEEPIDVPDPDAE